MDAARSGGEAPVDSSIVLAKSRWIFDKTPEVVDFSPEHVELAWSGNWDLTDQDDAEVSFDIIISESKGVSAALGGRTWSQRTKHSNTGRYRVSGLHPGCDYSFTVVPVVTAKSGSTSSDARAQPPQAEVQSYTREATAQAAAATQQSTQEPPTLDQPSDPPPAAGRGVAASPPERVEPVAQPQQAASPPPQLEPVAPDPPAGSSSPASEDRQPAPPSVGAALDPKSMELRVSEVTASGAVLEWRGHRASTWHVEVRDHRAALKRTEVYQPAGAVGNLSTLGGLADFCYELWGLVPGRSYQVEVVCKNSEGEGRSAPVAFSVPAPEGAASAPREETLHELIIPRPLPQVQGLHVKECCSTSVELEWVTPEEEVDCFHVSVFQRVAPSTPGVAANLELIRVEVVRFSGPSRRQSCTIGGLLSGTTYIFEVASSKGDRTSHPSRADGSTCAPPTAPTLVEAGVSTEEVPAAAPYAGALQAPRPQRPTWNLYGYVLFGLVVMLAHCSNISMEEGSDYQLVAVLAVLLPLVANLCVTLAYFCLHYSRDAEQFATWLSRNRAMAFYYFVLSFFNTDALRLFGVSRLADNQRLALERWLAAVSTANDARVEKAVEAAAIAAAQVEMDECRHVEKTASPALAEARVAAAPPRPEPLRISLEGVSPVESPKAAAVPSTPPVPPAPASALRQLLAHPGEDAPWLELSADQPWSPQRPPPLAEFSPLPPPQRPACTALREAGRCPSQGNDAGPESRHPQREPQEAFAPASRQVGEVAADGHQPPSSTVPSELVQGCFSSSPDGRTSGGRTEPPRPLDLEALPGGVPSLTADPQHSAKPPEEAALEPADGVSGQPNPSVLHEYDERWRQASDVSGCAGDLHWYPGLLCGGESSQARPSRDILMYEKYCRMAIAASALYRDLPQVALTVFFLFDSEGIDHSALPARLLNILLTLLLVLVKAVSLCDWLAQSDGSRLVALVMFGNCDIAVQRHDREVHDVSLETGPSWVSLSWRPSSGTTAAVEHWCELRPVGGAGKEECPARCQRQVVVAPLGSARLDNGLTSCKFVGLPASTVFEARIVAATNGEALGPPWRVLASTSSDPEEARRGARLQTGAAGEGIAEWSLLAWPSHLEVVRVGDKSAALAWRGDPSGGTEYRVRLHRLDRGAPTPADGSHIPAHGPSPLREEVARGCRHELLGLEPGAEYAAEVSVLLAPRPAAEAARIVFRTLVESFPSPLVPMDVCKQGLECLEATSSTVHLQWKAAAFGSQVVDRYFVSCTLRNLGEPGSDCTVTAVAVVGGEPSVMCGQRGVGPLKRPPAVCNEAPKQSELNLAAVENFSPTGTISASTTAEPLCPSMCKPSKEILNFSLEVLLPDDFEQEEEEEARSEEQAKEPEAFQESWEPQVQAELEANCVALTYCASTVRAAAVAVAASPVGSEVQLHDSLIAGLDEPPSQPELCSTRMS